MLSDLFKNAKTDSRLGWVVVGLATLFSAFLIGLYTYSFSFWIAPWIEEFEVSKTQVLSAVMLGNIGLCLMAPMCGRALDKLPTRYVISAGLLFFATGLAMVALAPTIYFVLGSYALLFSAGIALAGPMSGQWLAVRWFDRRRGAAIGLVSSGSSIGGFLMPPVVTLMLAEFGWRHSHWVFVCLAVFILFPLALLLVRVPVTNQLQPVADETSPTLSAKTILSSPTFWRIYAGLAPVLVLLVVYTSNLALILSDIGIAAQQASLMMSTFALAMVAGKLGAGFLSDTLGPRTVYFVFVAVGLIGLGILLMEPANELVFGVSAMLGLSTGAYLSLSAAFISASFDRRSFGAVMGMFTLLGLVCSLTIPLSGYIRDMTGSYEAVWIGVMLLIIAGSIPMTRYKTG